MGWAGHVAHVGVRKGYTGFWWRNLRERDHMGDPGVCGRIKLRWIFRKWDWGVIDWFDLVQERDRWRHLHVNAVMNIGVP
jgi:hypothetical protein